jgi:hypothetical protein
MKIEKFLSNMKSFIEMTKRCKMNGVNDDILLRVWQQWIKDLLSDHTLWTTTCEDPESNPFGHS